MRPGRALDVRKAIPCVERAIVDASTSGLLRQAQVCSGGAACASSGQRAGSSVFRETAACSLTVHMCSVELRQVPLLDLRRTLGGSSCVVPLGLRLARLGQDVRRWSVLGAGCDSRGLVTTAARKVLNARSACSLTSHAGVQHARGPESARPTREHTCTEEVQTRAPASVHVCVVVCITRSHRLSEFLRA